MTAQRYTGSAFTNLSQVRRFNGSAFVDVSFGRHWTGSQWVTFWPIGGGGPVGGPLNLDESTTAIGSTFNLTQTTQGL